MGPATKVARSMVQPFDFAFKLSGLVRLRSVPLHPDIRFRLLRASDQDGARAGR